MPSFNIKKKLRALAQKARDTLHGPSMAAQLLIYHRWCPACERPWTFDGEPSPKKPATLSQHVLPSDTNGVPLAGDPVSSAMRCVPAADIQSFVLD
ncbi:hypothetical protein HYALB_00003172 [Hymenoscyphus albidus]|uniref:Uncharacterized protein n=1 Tax=Hymenoscyphus albidus TaxID=595503 RepID=A0A9N9LAK7_9HELO|nr:hypothetical protein HYALB_00003172 [Hymenoscyphus albidus]